MNLNGIDATLNQLVQQRPKGLAQRETKDTFEALIESLRNQIKSAIDEASTSVAAKSSAAPASAASPAATAAVPAGDHAPSATRTTAALSAYQRSFMRDSEGPLYDLLSNDLTSASPL